MQRDYISEIKQIKSRLEDKSWESLNFDLEKLECGLNENRVYQQDAVNEEFYKYIPIRVISCFETFFRMIAKSLIDLKSEYKANCKAFKNKNIKYEFDTILAIESQKISIGDFISHLLPFNNFNEINSNISIILNKDFLNELKQYKRPIKDEIDEENHKNWNQNIEKIIGSVKNTFELRHIFCHEFAANIELNKDESWELLKDCRTFLDQADAYFDSIFYEGDPDSGEEWIEYTEKMLGSADENLNKVLNVYKNELKDSKFDYEKFVLAINKWKEFRDLFSEFNVSPYEGADEIYEIFISGNKAGITDKFAKDLILNFQSIIKNNS